MACLDDRHRDVVALSGPCQEVDNTLVDDPAGQVLAGVGAQGEVWVAEEGGHIPGADRAGRRVARRDGKDLVDVTKLVSGA